MARNLWCFSKFNLYPPTSWGFQSDVHLDVGCGSNPRNPFGAKELIGIDILAESSIEAHQDYNYIQVLPGKAFPLKNESIDSISGFDFIEHLPRGSTLESNLFISFMNESSRVLKKGGVLLLVTPAFPSPAAFQDPTHVNFISVNTVDYFIGSNPDASKLGYGFTGKFQLVTQQWVGPFTRIWGNTPRVNAVGSPTHPTFLSILVQIFSRLTSLRSCISAIRKPTHLLWVLQKI
jgi:SAM-dependent methyltransferase